MFLAVFAAVGLLFTLAAWLAPNFFIWTFAVMYLGVGSVVTVGSMAMTILALRNGAEGLQFRLVRELAERHLGIMRIPVRIVGWILGLLNWPVQFLSGIYIGTIRKTRKSQLLAPVLGQSMVPSWLQPPVMTAVALMLLELCVGRVAEYPFRLIAYCFVASTILSLLLNGLFGNMKDAALSRIGNPRITFLVGMAATFIGATISRLMLMRWDGQPDGSVVASAVAILGLADWKSILEPRGLTLASVLQDPGSLRKLADVTFLKWSAAALELLFYFGVARVAFDIFKVKRERAHHLAIGSASAVLGLYDTAEAHLYEARDLQNAQFLLCAVRLRRSEFAKLTTITKRLCATVAIDYSREEEAVIASICVADLLPIDGKTLSEYFRFQPQLFSDPDLPVLLAIMLLYMGATDDTPAFMEAVMDNEVLGDRELFKLFVLDQSSEVAEVRPKLAAFQPETIAAHLIKLWLLASTLLDDQADTAIETAMTAQISAQVASLKVVVEASGPHWAKVVAYNAMSIVEAIMSIRTGMPYAGLAAIKAALEAQLMESELIGEQIKASAALLAREDKALVARMQRPVAAAA